MLSDVLKHLDTGVPYITSMSLIIGTLIYSILYKDNYRRINKENTSQTYDPFLPAVEKKYQYTLVLDLDETLIHYVPVIVFNLDSKFIYFIHSTLSF